MRSWREVLSDFETGGGAFPQTLGAAAALGSRRLAGWGEVLPLHFDDSLPSVEETKRGVFRFGETWARELLHSLFRSMLRPLTREPILLTIGPDAVGEPVCPDQQNVDDHVT